MTIQFREGAEVVSADGTELGSVERLVIDPSSASVTHLVVSRGLFFPEERVVPVEAVETADDEIVRLPSGVEPRDLPVFEEAHYLTADRRTGSRLHPESTTDPLIWGYPPLAPAGLAPAYPLYPDQPATTVKRNVPKGSHVVQTGSTVTTVDGEDVGKVREVDVADDGALVSFVVDPGWFREERTVPAHFVERVDEDLVTLAIGADTLRQLDER